MTQPEELRPRKFFDSEDERGANKVAQIAIASGFAVYLGILIAVLCGIARFTVLQFLFLFSFFVVALLISTIAYPICAKRAPWLYKYFLMGAIFVMVITVQASTQLFGALFLALPILLACRYHDRRFLVSVIITSFLSVILKEVISWEIGMFDLNVITVPDNTLITNGDDIQLSVVGFVDVSSYASDVLLFSVWPQCVELGVITVVATLLGYNGRKLREHQREAIRKEAAVENEMNSAKEIQMGLLPGEFGIGEGFDLYASALPAKDVGGDFYDCFMIDDRHLAFAIADVSGKGMSAALFMATTKMCIRDYVAMGLEVGEVFTRVNRSVCAGNKRGLFVTAWLGILDLSTGVLDFVNAGHNAPLVSGADGRFSYLEMKRNLILGAFGSFIYKGERLTLSPGDAIVLYTDGVTESRNPGAELFGEERLEALLNRSCGADSRTIVGAVNDSVAAFAGEAEQYDDVTLLALRYQGIDEQCVSRVFPAQLETFPSVKEFVGESLRAFGISAELVNRIFVAADELFTNVAKYAYPNRDGEIEIRIAKSEDRLTVSFIDGGIMFNPLVKKQESVIASNGKPRIGGLGITVVKQLMDEVCYSYVGSKNIVTVKNRIEGAGV